MNDEPPQALLDALRRGEAVLCEGHKFATTAAPPPRAKYYCDECKAPRCAMCVFHGTCTTCGVIVQSLGAALLRH